ARRSPTGAALPGPGRGLAAGGAAIPRARHRPDRRQGSPSVAGRARNRARRSGGRQRRAASHDACTANVNEITMGPSSRLDRVPAAVARLTTEAASWPLAAAAICFTLTAVGTSITLDGYLDLVCGRLIVGHGIPH